MSTREAIAIDLRQAASRRVVAWKTPITQEAVGDDPRKAAVIDAIMERWGGSQTNCGIGKQRKKPV